MRKARMHEIKMAEMLTPDAFAGGFVDGDVLVYGLDGTYHGGFPFHAETSERISVSEKSTMLERNHALEMQLADNIERAIIAALQKLCLARIDSWALGRF